MSFSRSLAGSVAVAGALLAVPAGARSQSQAELYLRKLGSSDRATYQARQLVVSLRSPQSAAVLDVRATSRGKFVRAQSPTEVTRVWVNPHSALVSEAGVAIEDTAKPAAAFDPLRILDKYDVTVEARASGLVPLALVRREDRRLVERLWLHDESGVLYRRELYGPSGEVIGMMMTLDMRWGEVPDAEPYRGKAPARVSAVKASGAPRDLPFGYRLVAAYRVDADGRRATHWLYSDGFHALSVFRLAGGMRRPEQYRAVRLEGARGWVGPGPGTWMWEGGDATWTVVAEEPQLDPVRITSAFPRGERSVVSRMGSWWGRAARWVRDRI